MSKCVFPGSFNPFTLGHCDVVAKGLEKYGEVIVAVAQETYKEDMRPLDARVDIVKKSLSGLENVTVVGFRGLLTDFLADKGVFDIIRGVRRDDDSDYERSLKEIYTRMDPRVKVEYIFSDKDHISSSLVRTIAREGGRLKGLVSPQVIEDITRLYS